MFMGEYTHSIDAKGRIILPADFRQELGVTFIITKGFDKCLFLYGQQAWEELAAKLRSLPISKPEARAV
ncbi:MAG: cell division/cell wall cluster transcriptional repressor MraZ, partial [Selenomonas sp.]|nr:cell division/cell wall cluster transcriptional repressor MraZ [Selenomonas sp.]